MKNILGSVIKEIRKNKKMTQTQLGELTGFSQNTISQHENGSRSLGENDIKKYAHALNTTPQALFDAYTSNHDSSKSSPKESFFNTTSEVSNIMKELTKDRQSNVLNYAKKQFDQQNSSNNVVSLNDYRTDQKTDVDVYGSVSAGTGEYLDDIKPEPVSIKGPVPDDYDFAVKVNGNSMEPTFNDGQIILVKKVIDDSEVRNNQFVIAEVNGEAYVKKLFIDDDGIRLISLNQSYKDIYISNFDDFIVRGIVVF